MNGGRRLCLRGRSGPREDNRRIGLGMSGPGQYRLRRAVRRGWRSRWDRGWKGDRSRFRDRAIRPRGRGTGCNASRRFRVRPREGVDRSCDNSAFRPDWSWMRCWALLGGAEKCIPGPPLWSLQGAGGPRSPAAGSLNRPLDVPGGFAVGGSASMRRALEPFHAESKAAHATLLRSDFGLAPAKWDVWGTEFRLLRGVQQEYANASANLT